MWPRFHVAAHQTVLVAISHYCHLKTSKPPFCRCCCRASACIFRCLATFLFFLFADARLRHDLQIFASLDTEPAIDAELYSFLAGEQRESFLARCRYDSETPAAH